MKCEVANFYPVHTRGFPLRPIFLEGALESLETIAKRPDSFIGTVMFDDKPIAFIGMVIQWRGVATVWSVTSDEVKKAPKLFHETVLLAMQNHERIFKLWRLQMFVRANYKPGQRWAEALGFKNEGLMSKFDPEGRDYFRFARVTNNG